MNVKKYSMRKREFYVFTVVFTVLLSLFFGFRIANAGNSPVVSNGYLRGVKVGMSALQLKSDYTIGIHGCDYDIYDSKGNYISESNVKHCISTGDYILDSRGNKYTVVITGDIDGDGELTVTDAAIIKAHYASSIVLEGVTFQAANIEANGVINSTDYLRLKFHLQNAYDIHSNESFVPDDLSTEVSVGDYDESIWEENWGD